MAWLALSGFLVYMALAFGVRTAIQIRRTGSSGFHGISGRPGSLQWTGGVLFVVALAAGALAPILDLIGALDPIDALNTTAVHVAGAALFAAGLVGTLAAQLAMGASWRIGVDDDERTELVTHGPFALVRNPIFAAMIPTSLGLALLVPNVVALAGAIALITALQLQTRLLEEPYLLRTQGEAYREYAARVGRFVPHVGRLRRAES
jgi:protein-S-isoprenylcysteine O-methyltransferase Ste14